MRPPFEDTFRQKNHQKIRMNKKAFKNGTKKISVLFLKDFIAQEGISLSDRLWAQIEKNIETN